VKEGGSLPQLKTYYSLPILSADGQGLSTVKRKVPHTNENELKETWEFPAQVTAHIPEGMDVRVSLKAHTRSFDVDFEGTLSYDDGNSKEYTGTFTCTVIVPDYFVDYAVVQ